MHRQTDGLCHAIMSTFKKCDTYRYMLLQSLVNIFQLVIKLCHAQNLYEKQEHRKVGANTWLQLLLENSKLKRGITLSKKI